MAKFNFYESIYQTAGEVEVTTDNGDDFEVIVTAGRVYVTAGRVYVTAGRVYVTAGRVYVTVDAGGSEKAAASFSTEQWAQVVARVGKFEA